MYAYTHVWPIGFDYIVFCSNSELKIYTREYNPHKKKYIYI